MKCRVFRYNLRWVIQYGDDGNFYSQRCGGWTEHLQLATQFWSKKDAELQAKVMDKRE